MGRWVDRLIVGQRSNKVGAWLSKPGKDVQGAIKDDLLISSSDDFSNVSFLDHVFVRVKLGGSKFVLYGADFRPLIPLVLAQTCQNDKLLMPALQPGVGVDAKLGRPPRWKMTLRSYGFEIFNTVSLEYDIQALVLGIDTP